MTVWYIHIRDLEVPVSITRRENSLTAVAVRIVVADGTKACYSNDVKVKKDSMEHKE
jgi:hypothetical protein